MNKNMFERFGSIHTHSQMTLNYSLVKSLRKDCIGGHGGMKMGIGKVGLWNNYKKYKEFTCSIPPHSQNFSI